MRLGARQPNHSQCLTFTTDNLAFIGNVPVFHAEFCLIALEENWSLAVPH
jgi:hypothetical protein